MNVYVCTDHDGHYAVGVASVVLANDEEEARAALDIELRMHGLDPAKPYTLRQISGGAQQAFVLNDGDY